MISGDVLQSVAGQARAGQLLTKLTAMMFPPELSEPGVPTVHLQGKTSEIERNLQREAKTGPDQVSQTKTTALGRTCQGL